LFEISASSCQVTVVKEPDVEKTFESKYRR